MIVEKIYSNYKSTSERAGEGHFGHWLSCPFGSSSSSAPNNHRSSETGFSRRKPHFIISFDYVYHGNFTHEINYKSLRIETKSQEKNVKNIVVSSYHT